LYQALEHVLADQQAALVRELETDVLKCVKDQNGNHVVQKAIERVPIKHIQFILDAFRGQVHVLATHPYGCRVIQRILEFCSPKDQASVLEELHTCAPMLVTDQYGNYVTQHVIENGKPDDQAKFIQIVTAQLLTLSKHKFASNVVEKSIQFGNDEQRRAIVAQATAIHSDGTSPLQLMMKDQYGNYVVRKSSLLPSSHVPVPSRPNTFLRKAPRPTQGPGTTLLRRSHQAPTLSAQKVQLRQANRRHRENYLPQRRTFTSLTS